MWFCPEKYKKDVEDTNRRLLALEGELSDKEAKITLCDFLRSNIGICTELISGITLWEYQEIVLKGWFTRNYSLNVMYRGGSKSFLAAVFCFLYSIFNPGTKTLIVAPTFRGSRAIFDELEKIINNPNAKLLQQCFCHQPSKRNDLYNWSINGGEIRALPLSGDRIRGPRAHVLIIDEYLLIPRELIDNVLMPFLIAPSDMGERIKVVEKEDEMIKRGEITEDERTVFQSDSKLIGLSSASYTFENLYTTYCSWIENIEHPEPEQDASYFVFQLSYEAAPKEAVNWNLIELAKEGGESKESFRREFCAQFTDGTESYFSAKKMEECTIPDGERPHIKLVGDFDKEYIIAIDPHVNSSPTADNFTMCVLELDRDLQQGTIVHQYAQAGADLNENIKYFYYLYTHFNVVLVTLDYMGGTQFIEACNLSETFQTKNIFLKELPFDSLDEGEKYKKMISEAKRHYRPKDHCLVVNQFFSSRFNGEANQYLQTSFDYKRVWFGSRIRPSGSVYDSVNASSVPMELTGFKHKYELIDEQDTLIRQVKEECSIIEVRSTPQGHQSFDLPLNQRKSRSPNRRRKDSYSALLLGNWMIKHYYNMINHKEQKVLNTFTPILIK